jgi:hypothetical protein
MLITGSNITAKVDNACFQGTVCSAGNLLLGGAGTTNSISKYTSTGTLGASQMTTYGNGGYNVNVGWTNCARIGFDNDNTVSYDNFFQIYGTHSVGIGDYDNYDQLGS